MLGVILVSKYVLFSGMVAVTTVQHFIRLFVLSSFGTASYLLAFFFMDRASSMEVKRMIFKFEGART
jgi:hypothetical protein